MNELTDRFLVDAERFEGPVLVTGAGGCIASWVLSILTRSGIPCVAADLKDDRSRPSLVMGAELADSLIWEVCDVTDAQAVNDVVRKHAIRSIIHLAGLQVPFCAANPAMGARVNVEGTINIFQAARDAAIKRTVYASSVCSLALPPGGQWKETLYGVYKKANEHSAFVYWADWQVPTVGIRPNVVYGVARDQGMSSKNTVAIQAVAMGMAYEVPYAGLLSWLYAGEAAAAFIASVAKDGDGAYVFDLNGTCETVEHGLEILRSIDPQATVSATGSPFPFPPDMDDGPLRKHVGDYPSVTIEEGITTTYQAFRQLATDGRITLLPS